jgi:hypothetical protein
MRLLPRSGPRRRPGLPDTARTMLGLEGAGRVLAWSALAGGGWAAATRSGLRALLPSGVLIDRPWTQVDRAAWDVDSRTLAVWWVGSRTPTGLEVEQGSFLPEVVYERVRSSVVLTREVPLPGGKVVTVTLRKADDGTLSTQSVPGRGVRLNDPEVAALVARAVLALRDEAGLPPEG